MATLCPGVNPELNDGRLVLPGEGKWTAYSVVADITAEPLHIHVNTDVPVHMWMYWTTSQLTRRKNYRLIRGVLQFCNWTTGLRGGKWTDQLEAGDT